MLRHPAKRDHVPVLVLRTLQKLNLAEKKPTGVTPSVSSCDCRGFRCHRAVPLNFHQDDAKAGQQYGAGIRATISMLPLRWGTGSPPVVDLGALNSMTGAKGVPRSAAAGHTQDCRPRDDSSIANIVRRPMRFTRTPPPSGSFCSSHVSAAFSLAGRSAPKATIAVHNKIYFLQI